MLGKDRFGVSKVLGLVVSLALLLVSCQSSSGTTASGQPSELIIGGTVAPPTLDLTSNPAASIDEVLEYNVYQNLVELAPNGTLIPVLATSWNVSNGNRTYTFTLRHGVRFSNGAPMTPADVVFSLNRAMSPQSTYPQKAQMKPVQSVVAVGKYTVVVTLKFPDQEWLFALATTANGVVLDPNAVSNLATKPVGTGPYMVQSFVPNYSITLVRNPHYYGTPAPIKEVERRYFSSPSAMNAALLSGQINMIRDEPIPQVLGQFENNPKFRVIHGSTSGKVDLVMNNTYGPLSHLRVRQAISYAINKQAINSAAAGGFGTVIGSEATALDPWYLDLASKYPYDPAKAKQLLAQAGYPHGFALTLTLPPYGYAQIAGPLVAADLQKVGISVTLQNVQWPLWLSTIFAKGQYQMTIVDFALPRTIVNYANPAYFFHYAGSAQVASLLHQGDTASTKAERNHYYQEAELLLANDAVNVWLYVPPMITVAQKGIVGMPGAWPDQAYEMYHLSVGGAVAARLKAEGYI